MIDTNDNSICADRHSPAPWSHENEDHRRARHRLRRLGIDVLSRSPSPTGRCRRCSCSRFGSGSPARSSTPGPRGAATCAAARPGRREWTSAAIVGGLLLFVDTGGVAWAEQRVASGLTALLVASVPLFTALLDRTFFGVRLSLGALSGIAAGLLGVVLLVGPSAHVDPSAPRSSSAPRFAWAAGSAYARVAPLREAPFLSASMQMLCAAAFLAVAGAAMGELGGVHPAAISAGSLAAFAYPRRLRLDRRLHRVRLAAAERRAERPRLDLRLREPRRRRPAGLGVRRRGDRRSRARGGRGHPRLGRDARPRARAARGRGADCPRRSGRTSGARRLSGASCRAVPGLADLPPDGPLSRTGRRATVAG